MALNVVTTLTIHLSQLHVCGSRGSDDGTGFFTLKNGCDKPYFLPHKEAASDKMHPAFSKAIVRI
jgi:hypothetical protein